jgi:hypothetical protein
MAQRRPVKLRQSAAFSYHVPVASPIFRATVVPTGPNLSIEGPFCASLRPDCLTRKSEIADVIAARPDELRNDKPSSWPSPPIPWWRPEIGRTWLSLTLCQPRMGGDPIASIFLGSEFPEMAGTTPLRRAGWLAMSPRAGRCAMLGATTRSSRLAVAGRSMITRAVTARLLTARCRACLRESVMGGLVLSGPAKASATVCASRASKIVEARRRFS